jgi:hypothetical protein
MTNKEIKNKLSALAALKATGEPNALWATETRALLLSKISASETEPVTALQEKIKLPRVGFWPNFMFAMRPVMVIAMIFGFGVFGYFGSVGAIASALPGNKLYGFKTITENAQLTFAASDDARALLHAEFASRRATEVAALAEAGPGASQKNVASAMASLTDEMKSVSATMQAVKSDYGSGAVAIAKAVDRNAAEVRAIMGKTKSMLAPAAQEQVQSVEDMADDVSLQAVAVLAASPTAAKSDDVKNRVQANIDSMQKKLEIASPDGVDEANAAKAAKALFMAQKAADSADYVEAVTQVQAAASFAAGTSASAADKPADTASVNTNANANTNTNVNANVKVNENSNANVPVDNSNTNTNTNQPNKIKIIDQ